MNNKLLQTNYLDNKDNYQISYGNNIKSNNISVITLDKILEVIKSNEKLKTQITDIRNAKTEDEAKNQKEKLSYFVGATFSGSRANKNLIQVQHFIFDIDHVADVANLKLKVAEDKRTMACFVSPRGEGLKILCMLDQPITDADRYSELYKYYAVILSNEYGVTLDSTSDVARACFFSYDPDIYINKDAEPLKTDVDIPEEVVIEQSLPKQSPNKKKEELIKLLEEGVSEGSRKKALVRLAGVFCSSGFDVEFSMATLRIWNNLNKPPLRIEEFEGGVIDVFKRYKKDQITIDDFYSTEASVVEAGIIGDEFYLKKIGKEKFFLRSSIEDKKEQAQAYRFLVKNKHIHHLRKVNYRAKVENDVSTYEVDQLMGEIDVNLAPKNGGIQDNEFIEDYLGRTFGVHKEFIKKWLAVYFYTNYKKLPDIILTGDRGIGKNTFAESLSMIFPTMSDIVKEFDGNFNPAAGKKLMIVDESDSKGKMQYTQIKKYKGQRFIEINEKYIPKHKVENNLNIIIISNEEIPITVEKEELPTDPRNNQFFVYKMKRDLNSFDADLMDKLVARLVHYIRTVLKDIFDNLDFSGCRYSIPTPITSEETKLFESSITDVEYEANILLSELFDELSKPASLYKYWIDERLIPKHYFNSKKTTTKVSRKSIIDHLSKKGIIIGDGGKKQINHQRNDTYKLGDKFFLLYEASPPPSLF